MSSALRTKIATVVVTATTVLSLSVPTAFGATTAEIQAQIQALLATIQQLQSQLGTATGGTPTASCGFTKDLTLGSSGADVKCLQQFLNGKGFTVAASGAGSPGNETMTFGNLTKTAVAKWQAANGVTPAAGYFGAKSRAAYNAMVASGPVPPVTPGTTPPVVPSGTGLTVTAGVHPAAGQLHPDNAVRVPYTAVVFTASADGAVTVNSVTVERQGASTDATFSGVVLLDQNGVQVGLEKTLNSNHQAILSEPFTIPAGQSRTYWIAANRTTGGSNGTQAAFAVTSVSSSATVNGVLPIVGTLRTINVGGLTIGTADVATGNAKSVATTTEEAGKTMIFTAVKVTAGSTEDVSLKSIRFNQVGTVGTSDITGLEVKVDGTVVPHTVSADGKYFTATFPGGMTITKGNFKEITIGGTLSGGTNRTVKFDIYRMTDIAVDGNLYGYGINPTASTGFTSTNPVYWASQITVGKATLNVEKDPAIAATNIAINLSDQPLGGFIVEAKGEPISVASMVFRISPTNVSGSGVSNESAANIDQIKLVDGSGKILAGPTDGVSGNTVTFTDTVNFPVGKTYIKLLGKLDTTFDNNDTVSASTTPGTNWTTVTGINTGETITPTPGSSISGNTMTVKAAALNISASPNPIAQTIVSGIQGFTFANYVFDAQASGEDLRMSSVKLAYGIDGPAINGSSLTNCQLYDGAVSITSGSNIVNPSTNASSSTFTFDGSGFVIPKGTTKTLPLKCNVAGGATGSFYWGIDSAASMSATGLVSGQSVTPTIADSNGQKITLSSGGSYTVTDDSTPGYRIVNSGATGVVLTRLKFAALDEDIDIRQILTQLSTTASNTPLDLVGQMVTLYDEANPTVAIGTAQFGGGSGGTGDQDRATTTLAAGTLVIPKGGSKTIVLKGDINNISVSGPLTFSGDLLKVNYEGNFNGSASYGNYGIGMSSGSEVSPSSSDTATQGVRIMRGYPVFVKCTGGSTCDPVPSNVLTVKTGMSLYRFKVTAVGNDVRIAKFTFNVSSTTGVATDGASSATTTKYSLYAYTDSSFSNADSTFSSNGLLNASQCYGNGLQGAGPTMANTIGLAAAYGQIEIFPDQGSTACGTGLATTTYKVPAGQTRYFDFQADVANVESVSGTQQFQVTLLGDAAFPTTAQSNQGSDGYSNGSNMAISGTGANNTTAGVHVDTNNDFIWSPVSTNTSPVLNDADYTNGFQVTGLPAVSMPAETFTSQN